jgi:membrane associated rhomboid family serine protease
MRDEKKKILKSLLPPFLLVLLLAVIKIGELLTHTELTSLGIYPRTLSGLVGIVTGPLVHKDLEHLTANSVPLFVLGASLFYFYRELAIRVLVLITLITGLSVWIGAREAYHIGASGVVYGLAAFLFASGIIRREPRLLAITLLVTFLYGSLVWGIFPDFFPEKNISYEGHFWGLISGLVLAAYYRHEGPQRKKYEWEYEEEEEESRESDIFTEKDSTY